MRLYTKQHKHYCGIDLHTNKMYLCILSQEGDILLHRNIRTDPELFLKSNEPGRQLYSKLTSKHGKGKSLSILAHKLGRTVYFMLKNREAFNMNKFLTA